MKDTVKKLEIIFQKVSLLVHETEDELTGSSSVFPVNNPSYLAMWREGHLAFGGLLGKITLLRLKNKIIVIIITSVLQQ